MSWTQSTAPHALLVWLLSTTGMMVAIPVPLPGQPAGEDRTEVRIGILAYQDFERNTARFTTLSEQLSRALADPVDVQIAAGTYGDLIHWMEQGLIDLSVVPPGIMGELLRRAKDDPRAGDYDYIASVGLSRDSTTAIPLPPKNRVREFAYDYRSRCIVPQGSTIKGLEDMQIGLESGEVRLLFVDPLSVSGRIAPEIALRNAGVGFARDQIEYTHSHENSVNRVVTWVKGEQVPVAFTWHGATDDVAKLRELAFPELAAITIPTDALLLRRDNPFAEGLRRALEESMASGSDSGLRALTDWEQQYRSVAERLTELQFDPESASLNQVSLDDIGSMLAHYNRTHPAPARLALVLSGGGAKCSYQVGAVSAIEEKLAAFRKKEGDSAIDFTLVVGTSGGAINAVPTALGIGGTAEGRQDMREIWKSLDQRNIVRPSLLVGGNLGLWLALLQIGIVVWSLRLCRTNTRRRARITAWLLLAIGVGEGLMVWIPWKPWSWLGSSHLLHHAWLWFGFGIHNSSILLITTWLGLLVVSRWLALKDKVLAVPGAILARVMIVALIALPILQVYTILFQVKTFSGGGGFERELATKLPVLIDAELERRGVAALDIPADATAADRLRATSREIIERNLLKRDLVITGSCLSKTKADLPMDLYFFAGGNAVETAPQMGARGVSLAKHSDLLLDVVMGSGAVFPIFPPRRLEDFPHAGDHVELVDGAFVHNSPIEAAVLWGATHIVLIEASPLGRVSRGDFLANASAAFNHLYEQAQRIDLEKRKTVKVFTLHPDPPHICALDFAENLIDASIDRGYRDGRGEVTHEGKIVTGQRRFRKELGEPTFWSVTAR